MAPSVKKEVLQSVAALGPSVDDDFYMATFRGGKVQKVNNMLGGPPRRVRRVLDFDSEVEIEKEEALARKRKELGSGLELEAPTGKKEKTLAEVLLEMKMRKSGAGALATVQRKKLASAKKVKKVVSVKNVSPVKEVLPMEEVVSTEEVVVLNDEMHAERVVSVEETIPVEEVVPVEVTPPRKKRKRRSTSLLHTCSKLLDPPSEPQGDDETLAEYLKKSASTTTGRASSDNAGIKVFQRRKVKFKAVRKRASVMVGDAASKSGDKQPLSILLCDDLCECEVCGPLSLAAPKSVESLTACSRVSPAESVITSCSTSTVSGDIPEDANLEGLSNNQSEQLSHPDSCMGEFDTLTLPDDPPQVPVFHYNAPVDNRDGIVELEEEQVCAEVAQQVPSNSAALVSDFACCSSPVSHCRENSHVGEYDEYLDAPCGGLELADMPEVVDAKSRPELPEETSGLEGELHVGRGPCAFNTESSNFSFASPSDVNGNTHPVAESAAAVVTPMELDLAVERIESILETLVTPDDLLPTHLAASISSASRTTRKKKKRRRFSESASLDMVANEGSCLGDLSVDSLRISLRQEDGLAEPTSLDVVPSLTDQVPNSLSDITEEVLLIAPTGSSDILAQQISEHISGQISEQISELLTQEQDPTLSFLSEGEDTPAACSMDVELVPPTSQEDTVVNAEEYISNGSNSLVPLRDAVEVVEAPTQSPSCNEGPGICQTPSTGLDAAERDASVADTSTSKTLFSNLKTDGFSKRNRKSFSPRSQKALLEASRSERSTPPFKIKLMKSNLSYRCSSMLFSQKIVSQSKPSPQEPDPTPDDSSGHDILQCDVEQIQLVASSDLRPLSPPSQSTDNAPNMSASSPAGTPSEYSTHIVPGSPEYKQEPHVSRQSVADPVSICTPDNSVSNLPCTEGSLHINVECHPETPSDPKTPNDKIDPASQQLKSILKTRSDTCRGICECPRCVSTRDVSTTARNFIKSQMRMADDVARKLLDEIQNLRTLVEDASRGEEEAATSASCTPEQARTSLAKGALDSASKTEDWATKEILKMSRDSKRVCRLIETGPRRTIFADDAGQRLCHVKLLPAKKTLTQESLLPTKNLQN